MALDSALFTLHLVRREQHPWIVDFFQANQLPQAPPPPPVPRKDEDEDDRRPKAFSGTIPDRPARSNSDSIDYSKLTPLYTRHRATNSAGYSSILMDGIMADCLLASVAAPSTTVRTKTIQLHNPDSSTTLEKRQKTFAQEWRFDVEDNILQWHKESSARGGSSYTCEVIRKPDPKVLAAQYRPASKARPGVLQFMDYNLDRLEAKDKKGLEVLLVMTLSALLDQEYDEKRAANGEPNMYINKDAMPGSDTLGSAGMANQRPGAASSSSANPALRVGSASLPLDSAAELEPNEVLVTHWGTVDDYVAHCMSLLRTDEVPGRGHGRGMYMIVLKSESAETSPKTVQVAAAVKAAYYRLPDEAKGTVYGNSSSSQQIEDELYQYVRTEEGVASPALETSDPVGSTASSSTATPPAAAPKRRIIKLDPPKPGSPGDSAGPRPSLTPTASGGLAATASSGSQSPAANSRPSYSRPPPPAKVKVFLSKERIGELEPPKQPEPWDPSLTALQEGGGGGSHSQTSLAAPAIPSRPNSASARPQEMRPRPTDYGRTHGSGPGSGHGFSASDSHGGSGEHAGRTSKLLNKLGLGSSGGQG